MSKWFFKQLFTDLRAVGSVCTASNHSRKPLQFWRHVSIQSLVRPLHSSRVKVRGVGSKDGEIKKETRIIFFFPKEFTHQFVSREYQHIYTFRLHPHTHNFLGLFYYWHCRCASVHLCLSWCTSNTGYLILQWSHP